MSDPGTVPTKPDVFWRKDTNSGYDENGYNQKDTQDYEYLLIHYFASIFMISILVNFCL